MMKMMTLLLAALCISETAISQEWIVSAKSGISTQVISATQQKSEIKIGQKVLANETLITGENSKVKLIAKDSVLVVAEKTTLVLNTVIDKTKVIDLKGGKYRVQVDHDLAKTLKFRTPSSVTGVRGTEFFMSAGADKEVICVLEGSVETKEVGSEKMNLLKQNQGWFKDSGKDSKIIETSAEQRKKWLELTTL